MFRRGNIWLFLAAVMLLSLSAFAVVNWYEHSIQALPVLVDKDHKIAEFSLTNQYGSTATIKAWNNKIVVADFFFTHCPVVCPKMTAGLKRVQQSSSTKVLFTSFSVDPERDSVEQLQQYIRKFDIDDTNWFLLTGSKKEIYRLARNSFKVSATEGDGGPDDFIHSDLLILIDKQKRIRGYYKGTVEKEIDQLIKDIKKIENEN